MWWFTNSEERTMARRQLERRAIAQRLSRDANIQRLAKENESLVDRALASVQADEAVFERLYREPMPSALRVAVHLETHAWTLIKNTLNNNERRYLQRRLDHIQRILTLEREMLHTPLTRRYQNALERITADLKAGQ